MPFIEDLDPATPDPNDVAGITDDELRALKQTLNDQFAGEPTDLYDIPITVGPRSLNAVNDKANQADLNALDARVSTLETNDGAQDTTLTDHEGRISAIEADYTTAAEAAAIAWPVGSLFISADGGTPASKGLPGTWSAVGDGQFLFGDPTTGQSGGANNLALTAANLPQHKHEYATHRQQNGDGIGTLPGYSYQNPGRSFSTIRGGTNSPDERYVLLNTDQGIGLSASPTPIDNRPSFLTVRFYQRTA